MTITARRPRIIRGAIALLVIVAGAAGCTGNTGEDPTPSPTTSVTPTPTATPTPTPTEDPAEAAKQQNIDDAKAAYENFIAVTNRVEANAMAGWQDEVMPLLGSGELRSERQSFYEQAATQGLRQVGDTKISSMTVTEYVPDPNGLNHEQVRLDVCLDNSETDVVNPAGESVLLEGFPARLVIAVLMQRQDDGRWTVNEDTTTERTC